MRTGSDYAVRRIDQHIAANVTSARKAILNFLSQKIRLESIVMVNTSARHSSSRVPPPELAAFGPPRGIQSH
jgi:hypothetical protein